MLRPYYRILLSTKRNKLLLYTTTWMDLKGIMLSGKEAGLKRLPTIRSHLRNILTVKNYGDKEGISGCQKLGKVRRRKMALPLKE